MRWKAEAMRRSLETFFSALESWDCAVTQFFKIHFLKQLLGSQKKDSNHDLRNFWGKKIAIWSVFSRYKKMSIF